LSALWAVWSFGKIMPQVGWEKLIVPGARVAYIKPSATILKEEKKKKAVSLFLRELTT